MQLSGRPGRRAWIRVVLWWVASGLATAAVPVRADEASGTWTGQVDAPRGNYYWERSTRVVAPAVQGRLESPRGVRVEGGYLIDAITSASQATGVAVDVAFTEIRHDANLGVGKEFDLGGNQVDVALRGRMSIEPDYFSRGIGFSSALSLRQRNHVLRLNGYYLNDDVGRVVRNAAPESPDELFATEREDVGTLHALSLGLAYERTLTPTTLLVSGLDLAYLDGFQANVYRVVVPSDRSPPLPENHPDTRLRSALYVGLKQRIRSTRTTLGASYRIYRDTWEILSHAPELRVYQDLAEHLMVRLRYRFYTQTAAFFYREEGPDRDAELRTADPKMSDFVDHTFGLNLLADFAFLSASKLDFMAAARLDFGLAYLLSTNRFGDGIMGQAGFHFPF